MTELCFARVPLDDVALHVAMMGTGPAVILLHGWPEFWLSWRHVLAPIAAAGFTAVAPDMRGFNLSDAPTAREAYAMEALAGDVVGLMDALGDKDAILVGHDWGAMVAWHVALRFPDRVRAVAGLNVAHRARPLVRPTAEFARMADGRFDYVLQMLATPDIERRYLADLPRVLASFMQRAAFDASFWTEDVAGAYVDAFEHAGMRSVNLYRNLDDNWLAARRLPSQVVQQDALILLAENDPVLPPSSARGWQAVVPRGVAHVVPRCGHWMAQERPDALLAHLLPWLASVRG